MQHLFVYGSLLFPDLVTALTGRRFRFMPAILYGFRRFRVTGCDYPAIIETPGAKVHGHIIQDVDAKSIQMLTFFEGEEYKKQQVTVSLSDKKIEVTAFVWTGNKALLEETDWDESEFEGQSLAFYLKEVAPETRAAFQSLK